MSQGRRMLLLAAVIVVAVVVAIVAAVLGHSSGKSPVKALTTVTTTATMTTATTATAPTTTAPTTTVPTTTSAAPVSGPKAISVMFGGIPQHGDTLGNPDAPVTVLVFEDPQCPYCAEWNIDTLPTLLSQFVRTGKIKLVYRGILVIGANSIIGLRAVVAAGEQNKLWNMSEALYANQGKENSGWLTAQLVVGLAEDVGINAKKLAAAADSKPVTAALETSAKEANAYGVKGTPSFEILNPPALPKPLNETSLEPAGFISSLNSAIG